MIFSVVSDEIVIVDYIMEDDIVIVGVDYMVINGIFIFVFGEIIKIVEVVVNGDCFYESNEKFLFKFSNVSNVNLEDF